MKYKVIIEIDENRTTCLNCQFCNSEDYCALQDEDFSLLYYFAWRSAEINNSILGGRIYVK